MRHKSLETVDLNLLVALDALLAECNVSRAARRLSLTQSAVSRVLGRLRDTFEDELFVRSGRGMRPTRLAQELAGPLRRVLAELEGLLAARGEFGPVTAQRRFCIAAVDYALVLLVAPLATRMEREAPGIDLVVRPLGPESDRDLEIGDLDLLLAPRRASGSGIVWTPIHDDDYTGVVWRGHSASRLTPERFVALEHVLVSPWGQPGGIVDDVLAEHGLLRRVALQIPSFLALPHVLAGTERIAAAPRRMAARLCELHPLRTIDLPIDVPEFTMCLAWHEVHRHDPGHAWLRTEIARSANEAGVARVMRRHRGAH